MSDDLRRYELQTERPPWTRSLVASGRSHQSPRSLSGNVSEDV